MSIDVSKVNTCEEAPTFFKVWLNRFLYFVVLIGNLSFMKECNRLMLITRKINLGLVLKIQYLFIIMYYRNTNKYQIYKQFGAVCSCYS